MKPQLLQFWLLTRLTALETLRQPICLLLVTATIVLIGILPLVIAHQFGEEGRLVRDSALALHWFFGLFVAGYAACSSLARDMRDGTASTVLSKSVARETFFLAKFAGAAAVTVLFSFCAMLATLLAERIAPKSYVPDNLAAVVLLAVPPLACVAAAGLNYWRRRPFATSAMGWLAALLLAAVLATSCLDRTGRLAAFGSAVEWRLAPASLLIGMALIVFAALALALSTRLPTATTLVLMVAVFLGGLISDYAFGQPASRPPGTGVLCVLLPDWQHFWMADAVTRGGIPLSYLTPCAAYAALYAGGLLLLGALSFSRADIPQPAS